MENPFSFIDKRLERLEQQNQQLLECLQRLTARDNEDKLLSIATACTLFQPAISRQTLYSYEKQGLLQRRLMGNKVCFLKSEIMAAAKEIKRFKATSKL